MHTMPTLLLIQLTSLCLRLTCGVTSSISTQFCVLSVAHTDPAPLFFASLVTVTSCGYFSYFHTGATSPWTSFELAPCTPYGLSVIQHWHSFPLLDPLLLNLLQLLYRPLHVSVGLLGYLEELSRQLEIFRHAHAKGWTRTSSVSTVNPILPNSVDDDL